MEEKIKRLELEQTLSQIYSNNYLYDGPFFSFSFNHINFFNINDIYFYVKKIVIELQHEYLVIKFGNTECEIKYQDIKIFLINLREQNDV